MCFVKGAVHSYGDRKLIEVAVLSHLVHHSCQTGAAELSGAPGHDAADLLHQHAVVAGGVCKAQVLQNGSDLTHGQAVTLEPRRKVVEGRTSNRQEM